MSGAPGISGITLTKDASDRVVEENNAGVFTEIQYTPFGKYGLMTGSSIKKVYVSVPGGGQLEYVPGQTKIVHPDNLGTSRIVSTDAGRSMVFDGAFAPFGESYLTSGTPDLMFTGQTQDTVSGLYDFAAREYSPTQGRWISPDPAVTDSNRYAYAGGLPLTRIDPDGLDWNSGLMRDGTINNGVVTYGGPGGRSGMAPELGKYLLQVQIGYQNVVAAEQQSPATENWTHFFMSSTDTTVTISNASGTAVKNPNGSYTLTIVITQATFSTEKGQEGEFIGATTETKNITNSNPWSAFQHPVTTTTGPQSITYGQAVRSIGADGMAMAVAAATPGQLSHFPHQVAQDILHHPLGTLGMVIRSTGIAVMEVCPWCGTLMAIGGEALGVADSAKDNTPYP